MSCWNSPAASGDVARIAFSGSFTDTGAAIEGGSSDGMEVELEEGRMIPGFVEGILGLAAGETRTVRLASKVPVLIIYWTADRDDDGSVVFKPDPYSRDARELAALDAPFRRGKRPAF